MGITLRLRLNGEGAINFLPMAKAHLATINARPNASVLRNTLILPGATIVILRTNVVDEIQITTGSPYLYGNIRTYAVSPAVTVIYAFEIAPGGSSKAGQYGTTLSPIGGSAQIAQQYSQYVGDRMVLMLRAPAGADLTNAATPYWPVLANADKINPVTEFLPGASDKPPKDGVSFYQSATVMGNIPTLRSLSIFAAGWQNNTRRFVFGFCGFVPDGPTWSIHQLFMMDTGTLLVTEPTLPDPPIPGFGPTQFKVWNTGLGRLRYLSAMTTPDPEIMMPTVPVWFGHSENWGTTWSVDVVPDTMRQAMLMVRKSNQAIMSLEGDGLPTTMRNEQRFAMCNSSIIADIGNDRLLMIVAAHWTGNDIAVADQTDMCCWGLYISPDKGANWNRVAWPGDDWHWWPFIVGTAILDTIDTPVPASVNLGGLGSVGGTFGVNCFYMPIFYKLQGWKIISTRDGGLTWTISPALDPSLYAPPEDSGSSGTAGVAGAVVAMWPGDSHMWIVPVPAGTVISPFKNLDAKGRITFAGTDALANKVRVFSTNGTFSKFSEVTRGKPKGHISITRAAHFAYVGSTSGDHPPFVDPARPGKLDKQ